MLLPDNILAELSIYYNGALVLNELQKKEVCTTLPCLPRLFLKKTIDTPSHILLILQSKYISLKNMRFYLPVC